MIDEQKPRRYSHPETILAARESARCGCAYGPSELHPFGEGGCKNEIIVGRIPYRTDGGGDDVHEWERRYNVQTSTGLHQTINGYVLMHQRGHFYLSEHDVWIRPIARGSINSMEVD